MPSSLSTALSWTLPGAVRTAFMDSTRSPRAAVAPRLSRNAIIAICVVLFHVVAVWALQTGLIHRAVELLVPVEMLSEIIEPPKPVEPHPPPKQKPP